MTHVTVSRALISYVLAAVAFTGLPPSFHNSNHLPCATPLDNMSEVGLSSPPIATLSPLTVPSSRTPTPEPLNQASERKFWVELRHATAEERNYGDFRLNLREIVAEHAEGSKEFYYVLLGDNKYHKVYISDARSG